MDPLPPLNALRAFEVAGRYLNFRLAAQEMGLTQGAVAQQVRLLEAHLGLPLFERHSKGLAFTSAGRGYHAAVTASFDGLRSATRVLRPEPDKVLVSVTPAFAAKWLIPNLPAFAEIHPGIDLRIMATEKLSSFHSEGINLAIRQGAPPFGAALEAVCLFRQEVIAVASPHLLGAEALPLSARALAKLPKLHDGHDLWPQFLAELGVKDQSDRGLRLNQVALAIDAAISGQGVALVPRFLVARDLAAGTLLQVSAGAWEGDKRFYLLAEPHKKRSKATEQVRQWLVDMSDQPDSGHG
ncbi:LysR substrate-binding domain-containing protein [Phaeobacter sp. 11ANDIMAR09]|uniref:LysR substrate-binding domain-containing protein n=1 Tax=Phaeobacter sp. 11ANDIMAR09 TaxID=1225647 RepID=UPI0006C84039|nr:LysR substrate-binding domain-containing protein [Phaeobacter sp. 11ANDIMAR09]KPD10750.1 LysR family transcriptional regulator [Phaeobacter sp. 11ANDIMAR09]